MPAARLATPDRAAVLERLGRERFDVAIVGGGISGAGLAREAARRGLRAALLEAEDYASGTSSRSSKLIHGGLRYLAQGEVALVRRTARERLVIRRIAPHLAEPRWMVVPARSRTGLLKLRAGVVTYEKLGGVADEDRHRIWSAEDLAREEPLLDRSVYPHACAYREYLTDDARLVLANLRAAAADGAALLNHVRVDAITREGGRANGLEAECRLGGGRVRVHARAVVNAAGPWVESVRRLEDAAAPPLLHLSKGVHVALPAARLPLRNMLVLTARDRRSIFAIRREACVYVGTTDTTYAPGEAVWPRIEPDDVAYLLEPLSRALGTDALRPDEVFGAWAGLRPLVAEPGKAPSEISRRDEVLLGPARVVTMAGGKLTGYRPMAQRTLEFAAEHCGLDLPPAATEEPPLPGGDFDGDAAALATRLARAHGLARPCAERLARLYGSEAGEVAAAGSAPLVPGDAVLEGEVGWAVRCEGAATLEDVLYRRTRTALFEPEAREAAVAPVAARMAELLGWGEERRVREEEAVRERLRADLDFLGGREAR